MSNFDSREQSKYLDSLRQSMSSKNSIVHKREGIVSITGGFSLFPDAVGDQLLPSNEHDKHSEDSRDPAQIEAALEALSQPRNDALALGYGTPGDRKDSNSQPMSMEEGRRRTQYFQDQFGSKDGHAVSARDRVQKDSLVIAELRTNVIVKDEYTLVTDMSYHLSTRFSRPESSIMINVDHSSCLLLAGSFEPAYILTISALPSQIQPTTNKRNAALIQSFMADVLSVPPERGILRFVPILAENLASNGNTVLGEIERIEKLQSELNGVGHAAASRRGSRKSASSMKWQAFKLDPMSVPEHEVSSTFPEREAPLPEPASPPTPGSFEGAAGEQRKSMGAEKRKSINGILKGSSTTPQRVDSKHNINNPMPNMPPTPKDTPPQAQKVSKRKSLLAVFRKM